MALLFVGLMAGAGVNLVNNSDASSGLKAPISGVIDRQGQPRNSSYYPDVVNGFVVKNYDSSKTDLTWAQLQPQKDGAIVSDNTIDRAIANVKGTPVKLKLRIYAGFGAPEWAKNLPVTSGKQGPFQICNSNSSPAVCGTVGHFWEENFRLAYKDFMAKLAAKYDSVPEVADIVMTACSTTYGEPTLRQPTNEANLESYRSAGYNEAGNRACMHDMIVAHDVWQQTRSSLALNPYHEYNSAVNDFSTNETVTETIMEECRGILGARCVLGNNSIGKHELTYNCADIGGNNWSMLENYARMYTKMKCLGGPIYFQTATAAKISDHGTTLAKVLEWADVMGASMVELPAGYANSNGSYEDAVYMTPSNLSTYDLALEANTDADPSPPPPPASSSDTTPPALPTGLKAIAGDGSAEILWNTNSEADLASYSIRYKPTSSTTWSTNDLIDKATTAYTVTGLINDMSYDFQINAQDTSSNVSEWSPAVPITASPADKTPPTTPTNLTVPQVTHNKVDLSWNASSDSSGIATYQVWRGIVWLAQVSAPATSYTDFTVASSTNYTYSVKAIDNSNNTSAASNSVTVTTPAPPDTTAPTPPTTVTLTRNTSTRASMSWSGAKDDSGTIERYIVQRNGVTLTTGVTTTNYTDTKVAAGATYSYVIRAVDAVGNVSSGSAPLIVTIPSGPDRVDPSVPTGLEATLVTSSQVNLQWNASTDNVGVVRYDIYRSSSKIGSTTSTSFGDGRVRRDTRYNYKIRAVDAAGNISARSEPLIVKTPK